MKYYGVKKAESVSKENTSFTVSKDVKKKSKGSFVDVFLVQMCVCLMLICVLSVTKLLVNPTESVFFFKNSVELVKMDSVNKIESNGSEAIVSFKDNNLMSLFSGKVESVSDDEVVIKVNDKLKIKYMGFKSVNLKEGADVVGGEKLGELKDKTIRLGIIYKDKKVNSIRVNNNFLEW